MASCSTLATDSIPSTSTPGSDTRGRTMSKNEYHDYLKQVPLFADLDRHELDHVAQAATDLQLEAGNTLMREGAMAHEMGGSTTSTIPVSSV